MEKEAFGVMRAGRRSIPEENLRSMRVPWTEDGPPVQIIRLSPRNDEAAGAGEQAVERRLVRR